MLDPIGRATPIPKGQGLAGRASLLRQPVHIPDIAAEGAYDSPIREPLLQAGYRALLGVPLLREEQVVGVLGVIRKTPGETATVFDRQNFQAVSISEVTGKVRMRFPVAA